MAESADNTPSGVTALDEESDVIELTEEVQAVEDAADEDHGGAQTLDGMGFEMPEFKVPDATDDEAAEDEEAEPLASPDDEYPEPTTQRLSRQAIEEATSVDAAHRGPKATLKEAASKSADEEDEAVPTAEDEEEDGDPAYDRQSMVKTIQMDAFDRDAIEALGNGASETTLPLLSDARFAPEIIARQPRVLVKKWREGLPGSIARIVAPADKAPAETAPSQDALSKAQPTPTMAEDSEEPMELDEAELEAVDDVKEEQSAPADIPETPAMGPVTSKIAVDEEFLEADEDEDDDFEPVDLDEELIELDDADFEPEPATDASASARPSKSGPPTKLPPTTKTPQAEQAQTSADAPAKERGEKAPETPQQATADQPRPAKSSGGDDDMRGLVEELMQEEREQKKKQQQRPARPQDVWFEKVFGEEYLRTVPDNISTITEQDADFIEASLKLKKKSRILDLACGFGRHSIELSERGYEMVGLDLSRPLLERALQEATNRSLNVKFIRGDMRELKFSGIFDGGFVWDTSLGYFDDRTNLRVLKGIHRALKSGGRLLIDVINRDYVVRQTPTRLWWEGKGCIFLEESEFDYQTSTLQAQRSYIYEDGTPPLEHTSFIRLYNVHELRQMLHVAGFKVLEVSGARHHKGYFLGATSQRIIILAEKRDRPAARKK